jgi:signal peptidase I
MSLLRLNQADFRLLAGDILSAGHKLRFQASGISMQPFIQDGDVLEITQVTGKPIRRGDVLLMEAVEERLLVHRVVKIRHKGVCPEYLIKGDSCTLPDGWFSSENILGRLEIVERGDCRIDLSSNSQRLKTRIWVMVAPWVAHFSWLPVGLRNHMRNWLLLG